MQEITHVIQDEVGLHARPAGQFVKIASAYPCAVTVSVGEAKADAKRLIQVMKLGAGKGAKLDITCEGESEETAAAALKEFLEKNL